MRIGLGMAAIGRPQYINIKQEQTSELSLKALQAKGHSVLDAAYHWGVRYFDTAPGYGLAEPLLIDWLKNHTDPDIAVATKWGYTYTANFDPKAQQHEVKEHSLTKLHEQWGASKKLLPYLQVYQIHSATFESGVLENQPVLDRLGALRDQYGLIIGLTASGPRQLEVVERSLSIERNGRPLFDAFQVTFNMLDQSLYSIAGQLIQAEKRLIIKEALANGRIFPNEHYPHYQKLYQSLEQVADGYKVGIDAVALRYCLDKLPEATVLSGATQIDHLKQNLLAEQFMLSRQELDQLDAFMVEPEAYWSERKGLSWN